MKWEQSNLKLMEKYNGVEEVDGDDSEGEKVMQQLPDPKPIKVKTPKESPKAQKKEPEPISEEELEESHQKLPSPNKDL